MLIAPRAGLVAERFADEGSLLSANAPILSVIGIAPAIVRAALTERLSGRVARVRIVLNERPDAQLVPTAALLTRDGEPGVFVVDAQGSTVGWVAVTLGLATPESTEVVSPALAGRVVTLGQHLLQNGSRVSVPQPGPRVRE